MRTLAVPNTTVTLLLLAVLATTVPAAPVRFAMDASLLGVSGGGGTYLLGGRQHFSNIPALGAHLLRLTAGAEFDEQVGVAVGVSLAEVVTVEASFLPVTARGWWDFDPEERWRRRTAYMFATYDHHGFSGDFDPNPPYVQLGAGFAYTFYAITPKAEFRIRPGWHMGWSSVLLVGIELGGNYVFGSRDDW